MSVWLTPLYAKPWKFGSEPRIKPIQKLLFMCQIFRVQEMLLRIGFLSNEVGSKALTLEKVWGWKPALSVNVS